MSKSYFNDVNELKSMVQVYLRKLPQEMHLKRVSSKTKRYMRIRDKLVGMFDRLIEMKMDYKDLSFDIKTDITSRLLSRQRKQYQ